MIRFRSGKYFHSTVALVLALTYFLFQVEPFEDEYLEHHRGPADELAFTAPSITWESFDKSNAPKAFKFDPCIAIGPLGVVDIADDTLDPFNPPTHPVRDKSPPPSHA